MRFGAGVSRAARDKLQRLLHFGLSRENDGEGVLWEGQGKAKELPREEAD